MLLCEFETNMWNRSGGSSKTEMSSTVNVILQQKLSPAVILAIQCIWLYVSCHYQVVSSSRERSSIEVKLLVDLQVKRFRYFLLNMFIWVKIRLHIVTVAFWEWTFHFLTAEVGSWGFQRGWLKMCLSIFISHESDQEYFFKIISTKMGNVTMGYHIKSNFVVVSEC